MSTLHGPSMVVVVVAFVSLLFATGWLRRRRAAKAPRISDEEFLARFGEKQFLSEQVLDERRSVAKVLGIPEGSLSPEQTYDELKRNFEFLGQLSVGWNDLQFELLEGSTLTKPQSKREVLTIGLIVQKRLEARGAALHSDRELSR